MQVCTYVDWGLPTYYETANKFLTIFLYLYSLFSLSLFLRVASYRIGQACHNTSQKMNWRQVEQPRAFLHILPQFLSYLMILFHYQSKKNRDRYSKEAYDTVWPYYIASIVVVNEMIKIIPCLLGIQIPN